MRLIPVLLAAAILSGCATSPTTAMIPVAASCVPADAPSRPAVSDNAALKALGDEQLVLTIASERLDLISWSAQAEAIISACR